MTQNTQPIAAADEVPQPATDSPESRADWNTAQCRRCGEYRNLRPGRGNSGAIIEWCRYCHTRQLHRVWTWEESARAFHYLRSLHQQLGVKAWYDHALSEKNPAGWAQTRFDKATGESVDRCISVNSKMPLYWQVKLLSLAFKWFASTSNDEREKWRLDDPLTYRPSSLADDGDPLGVITCGWALPAAFTGTTTR